MLHDARTNNHQAKRASQFTPNRASSIKNADTPRITNKPSLQTKKSNLLEIPRQTRNGDIENEEDKFDIEGSYDGMNGVKRNFHKLSLNIFTK